MKDGPPSRVFLGNYKWKLRRLNFFSLLRNHSRECRKTTSFPELTTSYFFQAVTWNNTPNTNLTPSLPPSLSCVITEKWKKIFLQKTPKQTLDKRERKKAKGERSRNRRKSIFEFSSTPLFLYPPFFLCFFFFTFSHAVNKSYSQKIFPFLPICFSPQI